MYLLTEEEYFNLSNGQNDLQKLKIALEKEYNELNEAIDAYKNIGSGAIAKIYEYRKGAIAHILDKYL